MWRILTSPRFSETMATLESAWSVDDLYTAHEVLDAIERAEASAQEAN